MSNFLRSTLIELKQGIEIDFLEDLIEIFISYLKPMTFPKGTFLLRTGQYCQHIYLLEQGLAMYYQIIDGEEIARDFAMEKDWCSYIKSFSQQIPSDMNIRTLEKTKLYQLSKNDMYAIFAKYPALHAIRSTLIEKSFIEIATYNARLNSLSAEEHYKQLVKERPKWIQRVPQYYIASYMGIKPQSLSRIRKNISWK